MRSDLKYYADRLSESDNYDLIQTAAGTQSGPEIHAIIDAEVAKRGLEEEVAKEKVRRSGGHRWWLD